VTEHLHPPETITSIYLIRHGHTEQTEQGRLYTDPAVELTERGRLQAMELAAWVNERKPDILLSSTARRVLSTAGIIENETGLKASAVEGLNEWSVGDWEGRTYLDIKKNDPEIYSRWSADPIANAPPGGESIMDLHARIAERLRDVLKEHEGKKIALVTHAGVIRSILLDALEIPVRNFWRLAIPTGSVSQTDFSANFVTVHFIALMPNGSDLVRKM
jgi:broad specificity phosphatase PhoE